MNIIEQIKKTKNDDEIKAIIDKKIKIETEKSIIANNNATFLGPYIGINPNLRLITNENINELEYEDTIYNSSWIGFIPSGTKLNYGSFTDYANGYQYNSGYYYYIEDFSYIYEFAKYIKDKEFKNKYSILKYIDIFLKNYYLNIVNPIDRMDLHQLIVNKNDLYMTPTKEHNNSDFIKRGASMCTEYSSAAVNILSIFGIQAFYLQAKYHAYNMIKLPNEDNGYDYFVYDITDRVIVYDVGKSIETDEAYFQKLDDFDDQDLDELLLGLTVQMKQELTMSIIIII